jgi:hypothetical protein
LYHHPPERAVVLCVDEKSGIQALDRSQPVLPGVPERRSHDYIWHGMTNLFARFNIADGATLSEMYHHHRAAEFRKFPVRIDKVLPAGLGMHLVCDNLATHKAPSSRTGWPAIPGSACTLRRPGSSWINHVIDVLADDI